MTGRSARLLRLCAPLLLAACARVPQPESISSTQPGRPYVILVSFDAFRADYLNRFHPPAFALVAARGVRAAALVPSFPSKTFPNHYTIATGLYPGDHGIVGNSFYDPARNAWYRLSDTAAVRDGSWYGGVPIWVAAERRGVRAGAYFWPGSEAPIGGVRPSLVKRYDGRVPNERRVDESIGWLRLPAADRPHLVLMYFSDVDDTTHRYGPDAPQTASAVASVDRALRRLLDSLAVLPIRDSVNLVLVSDHGMAQVDPAHAMPVFDALSAAGVDTTGILASDDGPTMSLWFRGDTARMRRARLALAGAMTHANVFLRPATPERWHVRTNPRAGDLLLVASEGWVLQRHATDRPSVPGVHGYDPALPDMQGIFLAMGPNVRPRGLIPAFANVDVYPFLAALLRLGALPPGDGSAATLNDIIR